MFSGNSDRTAAAFCFNMLLPRKMSGVLQKIISFRLKITFFCHLTVNLIETERARQSEFPLEGQCLQKQD